MAQIKIDLGAKLVDGMDVKFKAPCDCTEVTGLLVAYINDKGAAAEKGFTFRDSHGNNLAGLGNLFGAGAYVKAILDTGRGYAYVQNADTNAYLEAKKAPALETPRKIGTASFDGSKDISLGDIGAAGLDDYGKVTPGQISSRRVNIESSCTLSTEHAGACIVTSNDSAITITLPDDSNNAIFPLNTEIEIIRFYSGAVTIKAPSGVYLFAIGASSSETGQSYPIANRYGVAILKKLYSARWVIAGDIE